MTKDMIIRAWKDASFRASLTEEQRASIPANPAGLSAVELNETELQEVVGGVAADTKVPGNSGGWICTYSTECKPFCL
ncbi:mersacidin/lichenicidin family type 2 lantibiotic [Melittangium boletus]|uniref:Mersacidin/lichenicidin family type 2 lantibiotic n=1 Tax=Melittangium boletus DSM 14713 TaxID=1294270 RepID=A0A250IJJ4_9BACT|nr:mersacidin/lichenicidin family type 2 lantibiotic [Melittangium boletus]ATB31383.1 hypothetical protein MEBOL_004845 [Melittangium boletus DSM 14713]BEG96913.1 mersacidin like peptide [synthetic construct]